MFTNENSLNISTKTNLRDEAYELMAYFVFVGIYLGLVFMITSAAILALKTLTDASDSIEKYKILRKVGVSEKMINRSLFAQNLIFFGMPIVLASIHSIFGIKFAKFVLGMIIGSDYSGGVITTGVLVLMFIIVIYGIYFILTNLTSKNIIGEKKYR